MTGFDITAVDVHRAANLIRAWQRKDWKLWQDILQDEAAQLSYIDTPAGPVVIGPENAVVQYRTFCAVVALGELILEALAAHRGGNDTETALRQYADMLALFLLDEQDQDDPDQTGQTRGHKA